MTNIEFVDDGRVRRFSRRRLRVPTRARRASTGERGVRGRGRVLVRELTRSGLIKVEREITFVLGRCPRAQGSSVSLT